MSAQVEALTEVRMRCVFCDELGGVVLWRDDQCRVVRAQEPDYPALCRVVWQQHIKEMSDLTEAERSRFMHVVFALEQVLRDVLQPDKMNLASLGNLVPHLHWHVVPRFRDDPHFPSPIWASHQREVIPRSLPADFDADLGKRLAALLGASKY